MICADIPMTVRSSSIGRCTGKESDICWSQSARDLQHRRLHGTRGRAHVLLPEGLAPHCYALRQARFKLRRRRRRGSCYPPVDLIESGT